MSAGGVPSVAEPTPLFAEAEIAARVESLADQVVSAFGPDFLIVSILTGAFVFTADLIRALDRRGAVPRVEFIGITSYGDSMTSSGEPQLVGRLPAALEGQAVLLVDDVLDTGHTLHLARTLLLGRGAAPVRTCVLIDKSARREVAIEADWIGFSIPDGFVVGYGIDYAQRYRHRRDLVILDAE